MSNTVDLGSDTIGHISDIQISSSSPCFEILSPRNRAGKKSCTIYNRCKLQQGPLTKQNMVFPAFVRGELRLGDGKDDKVGILGTAR
jgi:hypothetical protein